MRRRPTRGARLQVAEERLRVPEEVSRECDVLHPAPGSLADPAVLEDEDARDGEELQDRAVGGDDELRVLRGAGAEKGDEGETAQRGERRLRLVEKVEALRDAAQLEEV